MTSTRTLALKREALAALTPSQLDHVVAAGATVLTLCETRLTVLVAGCATDPRICHYETTTG